jgi:ribokinase
VEKQNPSSSPNYKFPEYLNNRNIDILAVGSLILEQVIQVDKWPAWGGQDTTPVRNLTFSPGGCAVNVACFCGRLGGKAAIVSSIGDGRFSNEIDKELLTSQVNTQYLHRFHDMDGNLVIIISNAAGDWTVMDYIHPQIRLHPEDVPPCDFLQQVKIVHIDGYSYFSAGDEVTIREFVGKARDCDCILSVDASVPSARSRLEFLRFLFSRADIRFANQVESIAITDTASIEQAIKSLTASNIGLTVIKLGEQGSKLISAQGIYDIPAYPVQVVDTIAAGDAFIAAMLTSLCKKVSLMQAAYRGSAAGALACLGAGSLTSRFTMEDVDAIIKSNV